MPSIVDVTSFEWVSVYQVAKMICDDVRIPNSSDAGSDSHTKTNEPNQFILKFWRPEISLQSGINALIAEAKGHVCDVQL